MNIDLSQYGISTQQDSDILVMDEVDDKEKETNKLILWNDEHNSFDWVIVSLMAVCKHTLEQSEQIAHIVHFKGKCSVKEGVLEDLKPYKEALADRGLNVTID